MTIEHDHCSASAGLQATLRDGTSVRLRPIRPDDKARLEDAFARLSPRSIRQRFFHPVNDLTTADLRRSTEVDFRDHVCIVLTVGTGGDERLIAIGRYVRTFPGADSAEIALTVLDEYQGRGAGSLLLQELVGIARDHRVRRFVALMLDDNRQMLEVVRHARVPSQGFCVDGVRRMVLDLDRAVPDDFPASVTQTGPKGAASLTTRRARAAMLGPGAEAR